METYYENYNIFLRCLMAVNTHIRKLNLSNVLMLVDLQQILENLNFIDVLQATISHVNNL